MIAQDVMWYDYMFLVGVCIISAYGIIYLIDWIVSRGEHANPSGCTTIINNVTMSQVYNNHHFVFDETSGVGKCTKCGIVVVSNELGIEK